MSWKLLKLGEGVTGVQRVFSVPLWMFHIFHNEKSVSLEGTHCYHPGLPQEAVMHSGWNIGLGFRKTEVYPSIKWVGNRPSLT